MNLKYSETCLGGIIRVNNKELKDYNEKELKEIITKVLNTMEINKSLMYDLAYDLLGRVIMENYTEHNDLDYCDTCGNWNYEDILTI